MGEFLREPDTLRATTKHAVALVFTISLVEAVVIGPVLADAMRCRLEVFSAAASRVVLNPDAREISQNRPVAAIAGCGRYIASRTGERHAYVGRPEYFDFDIGRTVRLTLGGIAPGSCNF